MVLQVHGEPEKEMNWSTVGEYVDTLKTKRISAPCTYFITEAKPYGVNWVLFYLWCSIRTEWWSAKSWYQNSDVANLGGNYQNTRESVRVACAEFNKYVNTSMIPEQLELEKCYSEVVAFAKKENPKGEDPIVTPPKQTPLPPKKEPEPEPSKQDLPKPNKPAQGKGFDWKLVFNWKVLAPIIVSLATFGSSFLPPPFNVIANLVVKSLGGIFN